MPHFLVAGRSLDETSTKGQTRCKNVRKRSDWRVRAVPGVFNGLEGCWAPPVANYGEGASNLETMIKVSKVATVARILSPIAKAFECLEHA